MQQNTTTEHFGRYKVLRVLGEGAMGRVFLAEDPVLQRRLAIKVIAVDKHLEPVTHREYLERFSIEARASARLNHQSIVTVHDAGEEQGVPWIAFEYVEGEALEVLLKRQQQLPLEQALHITLDISAGLSHAHQSHVVHRDVKPANILLDHRTGVAKLTDFGIVKAPWTALTRNGDVVGSPGYMSPEQIDGKEVDARSDLFSLGVVLYQMVTGRHPFVRDSVAATMFATVSGAYRPPRELRADLPDVVELAITRSLVPDREMRISTADELISLVSMNRRPRGQAAPPGEPRRPGALLTKASTVTTTAARRARDMAAAATRVLTRAWRSRRVTDMCETICGGSLKRPLDVGTIVARGGGRLARSTVKRVRTGAVGAHRRLEERFGRRRLAQAYFAGLAVLCAALISAVIVGTSRRRSAPERIARAATQVVDAVDNATRDFLNAFGGMIDSNMVEEALEEAELFVAAHPQSAHGLAMLGIAELRDGDYADASNAFYRAALLKRGKKTIRLHQARILDALRGELQKDEAPDELVRMVVDTLGFGKNHEIRSWVGHKHYWVRWNAVRILKAQGIKADMVEVYILDLQHGGSIRTRVRAAEKLGELKDRRAIPALKEARDKGIRDYFVSATAATVLEKHFK